MYKAAVKFGLGVTFFAAVITFAVFLLPTLSQTAAATLDTVQWSNIEINFNQTISSLTEQTFIFSVKQSYSPAGIKVNLTNIVNETSFPITDLKDLRFFTRENITYNETIKLGNSFVEGINHTNLNLKVLDADNLLITNANSTTTLLPKSKVFSYFESNANGWYTDNITQPVFGTIAKWKWDWVETKNLILTKESVNEKATSSATVVTIPGNLDADEYGNHGTKWFKLVVKTPISRTPDGWGSSGLFAIGITDASLTKEYHPTWSTSYAYKSQEQINMSGSSATNFPYLINGTDGTLPATNTGFNSLNGNCGRQQIVWGIVNGTGSASSNSTNYLYYNNCTDYVLVNGSEVTQLPMDVDEGNGTSYLPNQVYSNSSAVYHLNKSTISSGIVKDSTGNGDDLYVINTPTENNTCVFGSCINFDGSSVQYLSGASPTGLNSSQNFTIEAWVNNYIIDSNARRIFERDNIGSAFGFNCYNFNYATTGNTNQYECTLVANGGQNVLTTTTASIPVGKWQYFVFMYDATNANMLIYVNGTLLTSMTYTRGVSDASTRNLTIGEYGNDGSKFAGSIDEVRIWKKTFDATTIQRMYQQGLARLQAQEIVNAANKTDGRTAIQQGIKNALGNDSTIYTDQQIYVRYVNTSQQLARFDKVTRYGNQIWAFNYFNDSTPFTNMQNITPAFYVREIANKTASEITTLVQNFINQTRVS